MKSNHSLFSPSSADRWVRCPASVHLHTKTWSAVAQEGTDAHKVAEDLLNKHKKDKNFFVDKNEDIYAKEYVEYVLSIVKDFDNLYVEQTLSFSDFVKNQSGTPDAVYISDKTAHIFDYKFGQGVIVYAEDNYQLFTYALAVLQNFKHVENFELHIIQPRVSHFSSTIIKKDELLEFAEKVKKASFNALSANPDFNATKKGCKWCTFKPKCKALFKKTEEIMSLQGKELTESDKIKVLDNEKLVLDFIKSVKDDCFNHLSSGGKIEGYYLKEGVKRRKYKHNAEKILLQKLPENELYEKKLLPITKVELKIGKKEFANLDVTFKESAGRKLAKGVDKSELDLFKKI